VGVEVTTGIGYNLNPGFATPLGPFPPPGPVRVFGVGRSLLSPGIQMNEYRCMYGILLCIYKQEYVQYAAYVLFRIARAE
jgi:hypothetical protein